MKHAWVLVRNGVAQVFRDIAQGFSLIAFNGFALLGLIASCFLIFFTLHAELRGYAEIKVIDWIQSRHLSSAVSPEDFNGARRATASSIDELDKGQMRVALWLAKKYRVAPEPMSALVLAAYELSPPAQLDPLLVLAVIAIESNFNPYAESEFGAQGLMQVVTKIHTLRYKEHGGDAAAFDPKTNMRVGIDVLRDCIKLKGSLEGGLRFYVGGSADNDGGYVQKVLIEQKRLQLIAQGIDYYWNFDALVGK